MIYAKNGIYAAVLILIAALSVGCSESPTKNLKELGFYTVISGKTQHYSYRDYGSGDTERSLPTSDFPDIAELKNGDYILIYGDFKANHVLSYSLAGNSYNSLRKPSSLESFFTQEPMEPIKSVKLTKLTPTASIPTGTYFIHHYVGTSNDGYIGFRVKR